MFYLQRQKERRDREKGKLRSRVDESAPSDPNKLTLYVLGGGSRQNGSQAPNGRAASADMDEPGTEKLVIQNSASQKPASAVNQSAHNHQAAQSLRDRLKSSLKRGKIDAAADDAAMPAQAVADVKAEEGSGPVSVKVWCSSLPSHWASEYVLEAPENGFDKSVS